MSQRIMQAAWTAGFLVISAVAVAGTNIDATNKYAWAENAGWMNWRDAGGGTAGVHVGDGFLSGYAWCENVGWLNLGDGTPINGVDYTNQSGADFGVNVQPNGILWGFAWGENIGWVQINAGQFANPPQPAFIGCDGRPHGYAWGENIGWINLDMTATGEFVGVDAATRPRLCDVNQDGVTDGMDIQVFAQLLIAGGGSWRENCAGDVHVPHNHVIDPADVGDFVNCLLN